MTENAHWQKIGARKVANDAWDLVERHEEEEHGGDPCMMNRIGLVAFVAHVIGLTSANAFDIEAAIHEYDMEHANKGLKNSRARRLPTPQNGPCDFGGGTCCPLILKRDASRDRGTSPGEAVAA